MCVPISKGKMACSRQNIFIEADHEVPVDSQVVSFISFFGYVRNLSMNHIIVAILFYFFASLPRVSLQFIKKQKHVKQKQ